MKRSPLDDTASPVMLDEFSDLMASARIFPLIGGEGLQVSDLAIAVSGGADSMALAALSAEWARHHGIRLTALTVDHGLRRGSDAEAAGVGRWMAELGLDHRVLNWTEARPTTGIQARARTARLRLLCDWCRDNGVHGLLLAHHRDDQLETLLMRHARGSGPDGMAGMAMRNRRSGVELRRPLLPIPKNRLIATCQTVGIRWVEDPSNLDTRFERVRWRAVRANQEAQSSISGDDQLVDDDQLLRHAAAMGRIRSVLDGHCQDFLHQHGTVSSLGTVRINARALAKMNDTALEFLLTSVVRAVGGDEHPPRLERRRRFGMAMGNATREVAATLGHCLVRRTQNGDLWFVREAAGLPDPVALAAGRSHHWDRRFIVRSRRCEPMMLHALGAAGALRVLRLYPALREFLQQNRLPTSILPGLPALSDLDGRLLVPHLSLMGTGRSFQGISVAFDPILPWLRGSVDSGEERVLADSSIAAE